MADEKKDRAVLEAIAQIYCEAHHADVPKVRGVCAECQGVIDYTLERTKRCPNGHEGNCQDCAIHCSRADRREQVRTMMAYAAPRMFVRHPIMAAGYVRKKFKNRS